MNRRPAVSVVMPVYNVERFLAQAIASVLAQTFADFELLLVDDGSTDSSPAVCASFDDPRIRLIRQKNRGLAGARNAGIRHSRGRFVAFLDSDDAWEPDKLAEHVRHLEAAAGVGVSYSGSAFMDEAGRPLGYFQSPKLRDVRVQDVFLRNPVGNGSAAVVRREALEAIAFEASPAGVPETCWFDESFRQSEDIECWTRIALTTAWRFEGIGRPLTRYRVNAAGLSADLMKQLGTWERFVDKARAYAPDFVRRWGRTARAYQLRYLARRAVRQRDAGAAVGLAHRSLFADPGIVLREPVRTLATLAAVYLHALLPNRLYGALESGAMRVAGARQLRLLESSRGALQ